MPDSSGQDPAPDVDGGTTNVLPWPPWHATAPESPSRWKNWDHIISDITIAVPLKFMFTDTAVASTLDALYPVVRPTFSIFMPTSGATVHGTHCAAIISMTFMASTVVSIRERKALPQLSEATHMPTAGCDGSMSGMRLSAKFMSTLDGL